MISRDWVSGLNANHEEIVKAEEHHQHEIIKVDGKYRWKSDPDIVKLKDRIGLNNIIELFISVGIERNSEEYRKLYRDIGYSLDGYWELFYWEANNPDTGRYRRIKHDVIDKSYGYLLGEDGSLFGLTAGDQHYEDTGIKLSDYDMKFALENLEAYQENEKEKNGTPT